MTFSRKDPHEVLVKQIQEALTALGEMARSAAGQRVGHAVLVIPRWSHDALGTTALHKPTLKTKALPLSRTDESPGKQSAKPSITARRNLSC
jgi:hypothetical protein